MMKRMVAFCLLLVSVHIAIARADIPPQPKEQLQADATHIAIGAVTAIYTEETKDGQWIKTTGVVEVQVTKMEKGDKIEAGDSVYARFWTEAWIGKGDSPPYGPGHWLPKKGEAVRIFLKRNKGAYDAMLPNGFETIPKSTNAKAKP